MPRTVSRRPPPRRVEDRSGAHRPLPKLVAIQAGLARDCVPTTPPQSLGGPPIEKSRSPISPSFPTVLTPAEATGELTRLGCQADSDTPRILASVKSYLGLRAENHYGKTRRRWRIRRRGGSLIGLLRLDWQGPEGVSGLPNLRDPSSSQRDSARDQASSDHHSLQQAPTPFRGQLAPGITRLIIST